MSQVVTPIWLPNLMRRMLPAHYDTIQSTQYTGEGVSSSEELFRLLVSTGKVNLSYAFIAEHRRHDDSLTDRSGNKIENEPESEMEGTTVVGTKGVYPVFDPIQISDIRASLADDLTKEFNQRADRWERETAIHSAPSSKYLNNNYITIIAMGWAHKEVIVPLILRRLRTSGGDWFFALRRIADSDPAKDANDFDAAVDAWYGWAQQKGLVGDKNAVLGN